MRGVQRAVRRGRPAIAHEVLRTDVEYSPGRRQTLGVRSAHQEDYVRYAIAPAPDAAVSRTNARNSSNASRRWSSI